MENIKEHFKNFWWIWLIVIIIIIIVIVKWDNINTWIKSISSKKQNDNSVANGNISQNNERTISRTTGEAVPVGYTTCYYRNWLGMSPLNNKAVYKVSVFSKNCKLFDEIKFTNAIQPDLELLTSKNPPSNIPAFIKKLEDILNQKDSNFILQIKQGLVC